MHSLPPLILDLAIMLGIASLISVLFQKIKQPVVLGYLIAGIIIGPYTPPHILVNDIPNIKILSELGIIFLVFSLGLEFSFHKLVRVGFSSSITGFLEVILMTAIGYVLGKFLGWSFNMSLFLGAALSISSTTIIIKAIEELDLMKKRFAELIFGILIVEDLLAILLLVILSAIVVSHDFLSTNTIMMTAKLILVIGGWFIVGYFLIPIFYRKLTFVNEESITIISVSLCLLLVSLAAYFQYSIALGAFVMGSILAETSSIYRIRNLIKPIRDIFAAVFFIATGMLMDPNIVIAEWPIILLITVVTVIGKILSSGLSAFLSGQSLNTSIRVGFGMAQIGEFSFIIVGLGVSLNAIDPKLFPIIVAVSIITTFTTPYLMKLSGYLVEMLDKNLSEKTKKRLRYYSSSVFRSMSMISLHQNKFFSVHWIINGIIIAILFVISHQLLFPWILNLTDNLWLSKILSWFAAILASSPFLWGMIFSTPEADDPFTKKNIRPYFFISLLLAISEVAMLSFLLLQAWLVIFISILIILTLIVITYSKLEKTYLWFEKHLKANVYARGKKYKKYDELAPWDTYLVELHAGNEEEISGKSLNESQVRQKYGINVIAIQRNQKVIFAPTGNDMIWPNDKLIVLGEEKQIEKLRKKLEKPILQEESIDLLENVILKAILLAKKSKLIGKTIRESKIRENVHGVVVGLQRNGNQILNPDPKTHLMHKDILFIAGDARKLESIDSFI